MPKTSPINMHVEPSQQALLTKAAYFLHKDRSTFYLMSLAVKQKTYSWVNTYSSLARVTLRLFKPL